MKKNTSRPYGNIGRRDHHRSCERRPWVEELPIVESRRAGETRVLGVSGGESCTASSARDEYAEQQYLARVFTIAFF